MRPRYFFSTASFFLLVSSRCLKTETRGPKRAIVQMFEWSWDSVAAECTYFLGPNGYGYVQVSPPAEHITGPQWWTSYQPVSYKLSSKRGNRAQFANMVSTCASAGVGVLVDTLMNHMSALSSGTGVGGSTYTHYSYPGIYQYSDFHHSCGKYDGNIDNYTNRTEVQFCNLVGLADLATETAGVRATVAAYVNDLIDLGVVGLRVDAAKHIPSGDIAGILSLLKRNLYVTQEVSWGSGEPIQPTEYVSGGDVHEFRYTSSLQTAFSTDDLAGLYAITSYPTSRGWVPQIAANVFVANHDTERSGSSITFNWANNAYSLAHVFLLAYPYGTPTILSSYSFTNGDDGAPNGGSGTCYGSGGVNGWLCQHRWPAIAGMIGFFNRVTGTPLNNWVSPTPARIGFGRGSVGFVAINYGSGPWIATFTTNMPDGSYCDVIHGSLSTGGCSASTLIVSGGTFAVNIAARDAIAIHTGAFRSGVKRSVGHRIEI